MNNPQYVIPCSIMAITQLVFIVLFKFGVLIAPLWIILLPSMLIVAYVVIFVIGEILFTVYGSSKRKNKN